MESVYSCIQFFANFSTLKNKYTITQSVVAVVFLVAYLIIPYVVSITLAVNYRELVGETRFFDKFNGVSEPFRPLRIKPAF